MDNKEFAEEFAEINAGKNFMYREKYRVRVVGYNEDTGLLIVSGHPDGWSVFGRRDGDVLLVWVSVVSDGLYYVKPDDLSPYVEENKAFAEINAGKNFMYREKYRVRVVGYCADSFKMVLVSLPEHVHIFGWGRDQLDYKDIFTFETKAEEFWYVGIKDLK